MLRARLFLGLLTLVILLWATGAAALVILNDADTRFQGRLKQDYQAIDLAQGLRSYTSMLNSTYITTLAGPAPETAPDRQLFDETRTKVEDTLHALRLLGGGNERWESSLSSLTEALGLYFGDYERLLTNEVVDRTERSDLLRTFGAHTQRITDLGESLTHLAEEQLFNASRALAAESGKNTAFLATLVVLGTAMAVMIYFQLLRHLVEPVVGLRDSMEQVTMGNFELTLPMPTAGSEFGSLVTTFNSMAEELRIRRRETDERLFRNNLVNRALLSAIPSPVYVLDLHGDTVRLNPAAEDLNESLGLGTRLPGKVLRLFQNCQQQGHNHLPEDPREALLFRIDEKEHFFLPRIFRFSAGRNEQNPYAGWAVLLHDVTRIRWLDDMKTNLLSTVSHEIKTPLTGIRMVLHLLLEEETGRLSDMQRTMLSSASEDCERLLSTLNTLLDISRAESGSTHLDLRPTNLRDLADQSIHLFESKASASRITLRIDAADNLPQVMADPMRISEVVHNLVSNAIKHSPPGGNVDVHIARSGADFVRLSVLDDGPGVPEESEGRIFERFYRAPNQRTDGIGLGLFISREIMRAHEGRIGLSERNPDQTRTEFFIDVPTA
ncbi:signal transduction histidine kinase [Haloferula luteola]|uniref:histidine kinase n=1 Tax=Haloferula luteola TaxID=595692 RepID=A0A840UX88_9BACT|nr:ATP-binding protein [Haloferula luteola]MBB5350345.1 signal transduction histidine kinase [Haloferula luteola]